MERGVYICPEWAAPSPKPWTLCAVRSGVICEEHVLNDNKSFYLIGGADNCDIIYGSPAVSRVHAAFQFNAQGECFLVDLKSSGGTYVHDRRLEPFEFHKVEEGDRFAFGAPASKGRRIWLLHSDDSPALPSKREPQAEMFNRIEEVAPVIEKSENIKKFWRANRLDVGAMQRDDFWTLLSAEEKEKISEIERRQNSTKEGEKSAEEMFHDFIDFMEENQKPTTLTQRVENYLNDEEEDEEEEDDDKKIEEELERCRQRAAELRKEDSEWTQPEEAVEDALDAYMVYNTRSMISSDLTAMERRKKFLESKLRSSSAPTTQSSTKRKNVSVSIIAKIAEKRAKLKP